MSLLYIIYAYACLLLLPTLPLIWYNWARPNLSAFSTIIVLAFGISIPDSKIVVHTNTFVFWVTKSAIISSISLPVIFPCAKLTLASSTKVEISAAFLAIPSTLLYK